MVLKLSPVDDARYRVVTAGAPMPIEQTVDWDRYDRTVAGREPWGRLVLEEDGEAVAAVSFAKVDLVPGAHFLWAKFGPVWLVEPTAERERALRDLLVGALRRAEPSVVFVRLHTRHGATDLRPVMQGITFDSTVIVDLDRSEDEIMAGMKKRGRRDVRKAQRDESLVVTEETGLDRAAFDELYAIFHETGERADFGIYPAARYFDMISLVGPELMRMFVVRRDGRALAWAQVNVVGSHATYSIGASGHEARTACAPDLLQWEIMTRLRAEGVRTYDLGGVGSDEFPGLAGLTMFKTKFDPEIVPAAAARDLPVRPGLYTILAKGRDLKNAARRALAGLRGADERPEEPETTAEPGSAAS
ncbi:lipid II:glycine glycyltransferase FemX [Georgenia subflava]|uniref:Peptidoglycan bridge formation glycyltransferase FemA/FemB family protein n=1 Tax=Georgenia subflava TaxID=1622177 RepID=A0A6N7EIP0_9MICO|nr:peptidoglycan bridge formation glycyltransferase FemA/FemB family protein [Georgenia subflava]MPV37291.1 peptidoglycan bridge formation glycyltransferase FemA/FemB family protein [Georgenia subflava]